MTRQKSFKRLVRARMEKTGESYTAARTMLLAAGESKRAGGLVLTAPDERIRERTGRGWEEWFDLLDEGGALERTHRENARWLAEQQGTHALNWNVQKVLEGYELTRRLREVGEREDGFHANVSRTVAVPVERLYDGVTDAELRAHWLPDGALRERTATRPKSARYDWGDGTTRVHVTFTAKGDAKSVLWLQHVRLPDAAERERMLAFWRARLAALKHVLETPGGIG